MTLLALAAAVMFVWSLSAVAVAPVMERVGRSRIVGVRAGSCGHCGYSREGLSVVDSCPECGLSALGAAYQGDRRRTLRLTLVFLVVWGAMLVGGAAVVYLRMGAVGLPGVVG